MPFKRILLKRLAPYIVQVILGKDNDNNLTLLLYVIAYLFVLACAGYQCFER